MPSIERIRLSSAVASVVVMLACLHGAAGAQQTAAPATSATVSAGEKNVYAAGGRVRTPSGLGGDFIAAGGKVVVDQPVAADVSVAGGSVDVRAPVGDDVRAVGGDISLENKIGGEVFAAGGNISLSRASSVARAATFYGGRVTIDGRVEGDLKASGQKIVFDGEVLGNARLAGEQIELGPHARIAGAVSYASPSELKKAEGATIGGALTRDDQAVHARGPHAERSWQHEYRGPSWIGGVMSFLSFLAVAALFILVVPRFGEQAAARIQSSPWLSLAVGFGTCVAVPVLAVLLFVTILGIPLGIVLMALYPAVLMGGFVIGVLFVARLLARALRKEPPVTFAPSMGYFALALLLMLLVASVPVVGSLAAGLLGLAGVGSCILEIHGRRKGPAGQAVEDRPPVAPTPA